MTTKIVALTGGQRTALRAATSAWATQAHRTSAVAIDNQDAPAEEVEHLLTEDINAQAIRALAQRTTAIVLSDPTGRPTSLADILVHETLTLVAAVDDGDNDLVAQTLANIRQLVADGDAKGAADA